MKINDSRSKLNDSSKGSFQNSIIKAKNLAFKPVLILFLFTICTTYTNAQYSIGLGLVGGTSTGFDFESINETVSPGVQLKMQYRVKDFLVISPNVTIFKKSEENSLSYSYFETSIDVQYNVLNNEYNRGYLIAGPTYNRTDFVLPATVNGIDAIAEGGVNRYGGNLGFGIEQKSSFYQEIMVQYKSKLKGSNFREVQFLLKIGYLMNFGKPKSFYREGAEILSDQL